MKKEIIEQLLNKKPTILKTKFAQESLRLYAKIEKLSNEDIDFIYKNNGGKKHQENLNMMTS